MFTTCKNKDKIRITDVENIIIDSLGNYLDEGIVELSTLLLVEKYNLFYIPSNYLKNVLFAKESFVNKWYSMLLIKDSRKSNFFCFC